MRTYPNYIKVLWHWGYWNWPSIDHRLSEIAYHLGPLTIKKVYI
jgi:hypothetical protein